MTLIELIPSVLGLIFTMNFEYDKTILLALGGVHGSWKINGQGPYHFNPHMNFLRCIKSTNKHNKYEDASQCGRG